MNQLRIDNPSKVIPDVTFCSGKISAVQDLVKPDYPLSVNRDQRKTGTRKRSPATPTEIRIAAALTL